VLTTEATDILDKDMACIKRVGRNVQLIGRTDNRGTEEYNLALSERRAQSVKKRLQQLGADGGQLRTLPKGELEATGKDEAGWANDRRVDFEWM
jgi:peptidoglycan-associated lipoprotein